MSLLIKALHKAEQSKVSAKDIARTDLALEPVLVSKMPETGIADDDGLTQVASANTQQKHVSQQAATTMFAAKNAPANSAVTKKTLLIAVASLLLLALIGMQFYSYLDNLNQPQLIVAKVAPALTNTITEAPPENSTAHPLSESAAAAAMVVPVATEVDVHLEKPINSPLEAKAESTPKVTPIEPVSQRLLPTPKSRQLSFGEPIATSESTDVKITRNTVVTGVNPTLLAAYAAFNAGDDATAQRNYRQVLQSDVRNVDALLGMAAIAGHQNRNEDALGWYGKVLEVEPRNSVAQAAMIGLFSQADPVGSESRIKSLLAQQPEAAHLHAALGAIYAEQSQWPAAQQAYFQAHHFAPDNADYAFNLAVSLDQLGKSALALQYYKQALELLPKSGGDIDRAQLESRIAQLQ